MVRVAHRLVLALVLGFAGQPATAADKDRPDPIFPQLIEFGNADDYAPHIPYIWIALEAFNNGTAGDEAIPYVHIKELAANKTGRLVAPERCTEFVQKDWQPDPAAHPRNTLDDYLRNPWGVFAATVVDEIGGFFYGEPYRLLALEMAWHTRAAEPALPPPMENVLAAVSEVSMAFGDEVFCSRISGASVNLLSVGTRFLFFPSEVLPKDGFVHFKSVDDLVVDLEGRLSGAENLVSNLDFPTDLSFEELELYLRRRMGPIEREGGRGE